MRVLQDEYEDIRAVIEGCGGGREEDIMRYK